MEHYDIVIIGTGPAGISAAITATIRNKKIMLIGSKELSPKMRKAEKIKNYPGLPDASGTELQRAFASHLRSMNIEIHEGRAVMVMPMSGYFSVQTDFEEGGTIIDADAVILATGVVSAKPFPGEDEFLGRGVSYCATCDAPLYKDKVVAVIGGDPGQESEAAFLSEYAGTVYYLPLYQAEPELGEEIQVIREMPAEIKGTLKADTLVTDAGEYPVDGIFVLRESIAPDQLVPGLETEGPHIVVDRQMATNFPGLFACGDITGRPYQYVKSAGEGNVAALSAVAYLDEKRRAE